MDEYIQAFEIFRDHGAGKYDVCAEHDELHVMIKNVPPDGQIELLNQWGWYSTSDSEPNLYWRKFV